MPTVAELIVVGLADLGVKNVWGVVGDALNPVTDAIRREPRLEWIGVRHEEAGAFAAGAQAHLSGTLGVCMGTVGPGSIHLLNGLYDAKKSRVPVLALCGQVPLPEIGSDFFQEVDNDQLFADVAAFSRTPPPARLLIPSRRSRVHAQVRRRPFTRRHQWLAIIPPPSDDSRLQAGREIGTTVTLDLRTLFGTRDRRCRAVILIPALSIAVRPWRTQWMCSTRLCLPRASSVRPPQARTRAHWPFMRLAPVSTPPMSRSVKGR